MRCFFFFSARSSWLDMTSIQSFSELPEFIVKQIIVGVTKSKWMSFRHARKHFSQAEGGQLDEVRQVMGMLAFPSDTHISPYKVYFISIWYWSLIISEYAIIACMSSVVCNISCLSSQDLLDPARWKMLIQQFRYDNYRLHQLGNNSVFTITLQAGLSAIKTPYPLCRKTITILRVFSLHVQQIIYETQDFWVILGDFNIQWQ